jgi:hypothetical protein
MTDDMPVAALLEKSWDIVSNSYIEAYIIGDTCGAEYNPLEGKLMAHKG